MDDANFDLIEDGRGGLILRRPGQEDVADVQLRRAFPWSFIDRYISVRGADGSELVLIENLHRLKPQQGQLVERALAQMVFIPRITRVKDLDIRFGYQNWRVQTDRGPREFRVQEREDIRFLPDGRFSIKDADGNVYELDRLDRLDDSTRRVLERVL